MTTGMQARITTEMAGGTLAAAARMMAMPPMISKAVVTLTHL